jgi:hypothetical protein
MTDQDQSGMLAIITPSAARRAFAVGVMGGLGLLLELLAFLRPPAVFSLQLLLVLLGVVALIGCVRMFNATSRGLVLSATDLRDTDGRLLTPLSDIEKVERGVFAFKPSNGFVLRLKTPMARAWEPGLWWRVGRRVGVGGVISGAEGRQMADAIAARLISQTER